MLAMLSNSAPFPSPSRIRILFRRVFRIFSRPGSSSPSGDSPPPDPFQELPHAENNELFRAFAPFYSAKLQAGSYNAHPDLAERLYELEPSGEVIRANAYGFPVMANSQGMVFAWAKGQWTVLIKLGDKYHQAARAEKGRINTEYGRNWIEFPAWWGPDKPEPTPEPPTLERKRAQWSASLRHWMQIAYDDGLKQPE
jgi:hypothetical protein